MVLTLQIGTGRRNGRGPRGRFILDVTGRVYTLWSPSHRTGQAMRTGLEALAQRDHDLVVDKVIVRIPAPGGAVLGRESVHPVGTARVQSIQSPGIGFADRHGGC